MKPDMKHIASHGLSKSGKENWDPDQEILKMRNMNESSAIFLGEI